MAKLIIMQGLPASGKSTKAQELLEASGNAVRLNKDLLRKMLHFDKWTGKREGQTFHAEQILAKAFLGQNKNVIIDDTNLNPTVLRIWKELHQNHEVINMDTSYQECVKRDMFRDDSVGRQVIFAMARKYDRFPWGDTKEVICDIDGTIANIEHRRHFVQGEKKDWKSFFEAMTDDTVREDVLGMLKRYREAGRRIIMVSGRPDNYSTVTELWLEDHGIPYDGLLLRKASDGRPDDQVKQDILNKFFKKELVDVVIDDRPSVIRMWRANGFEVFDVGTGEDF